MTTVDREKLRALAEAATKGPWLYRPRQIDDWGVVRAKTMDGFLVAAARSGDGRGGSDFDLERARNTDPYEPNGQFIAAFNPATALALLASHDALCERVRELEDDKAQRVALAIREAEAEGARREREACALGCHKAADFEHTLLLRAAHQKDGLRARRHRAAREAYATAAESIRSRSEPAPAGETK